MLDLRDVSFLVEVLGNNIVLDGQQLLLRVIRDVTDRRHHREERRSPERQLPLAQMINSLGVLAGGIAHDLHSLLAAILGKIELAIEDHPDRSCVAVNLKEPQSAGIRVAEPANRMLA